MTEVNGTVDVDAPVSKVYNLWTRFESFPQFMSGVESVRQLSDTMLHWTVSVGGVEREFDAEITEQTPDQRIAWKSTDGESHAGVVTFHELSPDQTRVSLQLDWKPQGFVEHAGAVLQIDDMQIKGDLGRFKDLAEETGGSSQGWRGDVDRTPDSTGD